MTTPRPNRHIQADASRSEAVDWTAHVHPDVRRRHISAMDASLKSFDRRSGLLVMRDGVPFHQSTMLAEHLNVDVDDFSWVPRSFSILKYASFGDELVIEGQKGRLQRVGRITVGWFGDRREPLPIPDAPRAPFIESEDIDEFAVAIGVASRHSSWFAFSFDQEGNFDVPTDWTLSRLGLITPNWNWIPDSWRTEAHPILDVIELPDGRKFLATGELIQHELGNLAMFKLEPVPTATGG